jgi:hypothetical protein
LEPNNIFEPESAADAPSTPRTVFDWTIWIQWVLATTVGWILGIVLGDETGVGFFVGLAQWVVLRRFFAQAWWWILASTAGWMAGWAIITSGLFVSPGGGLFTTIISGAVFGLSMGAAQWIVLRRWVKLSSLWILLSIPGWTIGLIGLLGSILAGAVIGAITGLAFDFLLRFPRSDVRFKN